MSEDEISQLNPDALDRLYELYRLHCEGEGSTPRLSDFHTWLQER